MQIQFTIYWYFIGMWGTVRAGREPGQRQHKTWSSCIFTNGEIA